MRRPRAAGGCDIGMNVQDRGFSASPTELQRCQLQLLVYSFASLAQGEHEGTQAPALSWIVRGGGGGGSLQCSDIPKHG